MSAQPVPDIAATLLEMIEQHINGELEFWGNFQAVCKGMPPKAGGGTACEGQGKGVTMNRGYCSTYLNRAQVLNELKSSIQMLDIAVNEVAQARRVLDKVPSTRYIAEKQELSKVLDKLSDTLQDSVVELAEWEDELYETPAVDD